MSCSPRSPRSARLIDRLFVAGRVAPWRFRRMWRHLEGCEACRGYYDRAALVWRQMGPGAEPPQIAETRAQAAIDSLPREGKARPRFALFGLGAVAGVAAVALLVVRLIPHGNGEWIERGGTAPSRVRAVRAFCIARSPSGEPSIRADALFGNTPPNELRCGLADEIQFAYSLGEGAAETLAITGVDESGQRHDYQPATTLRAGFSEEPLQGSVRLAAGHRAGRVTLEASFGDTARQRLVLVIDP
jgi:hypothetical protein